MHAACDAKRAAHSSAHSRAHSGLLPRAGERGLPSIASPWGWMPSWEIISGPREYPLGGGSVQRRPVGRDLAWAYVIERGNERLTVRVERDAALAESEVVSEAARSAVATSGRSAVGLGDQGVDREVVAVARRACGPVIHCEVPSAAAVRPSKEIAALSRQNGRPVRRWWR